MNLCIGKKCQTELRSHVFAELLINRTVFFHTGTDVETLQQFSSLSTALPPSGAAVENHTDINAFGA